MDTTGRADDTPRMSDPLAERLAARFRDDAQALRARAIVLDTQRGPRGHGPTAAACRAMADACDRVSALLGTAADESALRAAVPALEKLRTAERSTDVRYVYDGALTRLRQSLDADGLDDDEEDDDEEDDEDDDE